MLVSCIRAFINRRHFTRCCGTVSYHTAACRQASVGWSAEFESVVVSLQLLGQPLLVLVSCDLCERAMSAASVG